MTSFVQSLVSTYVSGAGVAQSGFHTFSFVLSHEYEGWAPIIITNPGTTSLSTGAEVQLYRSADFGATYETEGNLANVFPRPTAAALVQSQAIFFRPGWYLVSVQVGGGVASTFTAQFGTAWVLTAQE